jgi:hypothetical protein
VLSREFPQQSAICMTDVHPSLNPKPPSFNLLGTPSEESWPGVSQYSEWKAFPWFPCQDMSMVLGGVIDHIGMDLLLRMLQYQPQLRVGFVIWNSNMIGPGMP